MLFRSLTRLAHELGLAPMAFLGAGAGFAMSQFAEEQAISEDVLSSTEWAPDVSWPGARAWALRYEKEFGKKPTYHASGAYQSTLIMGRVAAQARGDRAKIRELRRSGKWNGITGEVTFSDFDGYTNQNKHVMLVQQVKQGQYVTVWPPAIASRKPVWPFPGWK